MAQNAKAKTRVSRRAGATPHTPGENMTLESELNFPHVPLHAHVGELESDMNGDVDEDNNKDPGLKGDRWNIALLVFLYVLQGIPLGLAGSIPYLLQGRNVSYKDQAVFSFVYWPFSVKLLWAPIVDSVYSASFGRRKSWLVPVQYLIGIFMLVLSYKIPGLLGEGEDASPVSVVTLTAVFFCLNFLAATQDIAVDGWALTMLSRRNVGWASTCNTVGQTAGYFMGYVVFLALESPDFCNRYLRTEPSAEGVVTFSDFLYFWGIVFFITTTFVMVIKKENSDTSSADDEPEYGVVGTYKLLWRIIQLPAVVSLIVILLTVKMGFAASDAVTGLKLIEEGVPREKLALLGVPMVPVQIILPIVISRYTTGPRPMDVFLKAMPYRLLMGIVFAAIVWWTPSTRTSEGDYPFYYYCVVLGCYAIHQMALYCMYVTTMAFFARVCDPKIGGSYMTLLNTVSNFGGNWPTTVALWFVDPLTWKECIGGTSTCDDKAQEEMCRETGGSCVTTIDGYYIETVVCIVIGFLWIAWKSRTLRNLQALGPQAWTCS